MTEKKRTSILALVRALAGPYGELRQFLKPYRARFITGLACGAFLGLVNGLLPWVVQQVSAIIFYGQAQTPFLSRAHRPDGSLPGAIIFGACLAIPAVMILRGLFSFLNGYFVDWVSGRVLMDLRSRLLANVTLQSLDFFNKMRAGELISRITNETREAQTALTTMSTDLIAQPITLLTGVIVLFNIDWRFMLGTILVFPICLIPARRLGKKIRAAATHEEHERGEMTVILHEIIAGIKVVKSFSRASFEVARFAASGEAQFRQSMRVRRALESLPAVVEGLAAIGIGCAFFYVHFSHLPGNKFIAMCAGIFLLYQPIKSLTRLHLLLQKSLAATTGIFELMKLQPSVQEAPHARPLSKCDGEIVFDAVRFAYRPGIPALDCIDLRFEPGKYYALVGASGAGKSTMLSLILRFYDPVAGRIRIDGFDLRELALDSLREKIGIVTQETFLFHESIFKNIAYGRLDATREEVIAAAIQANAHDFILAQPHGYETIVGDKGCMLSGGQQQRLAIARALLKNAPVLLLDEATASLDSESEIQIQSALEALVSGRTVIAIAHRLSTILKADRIIVLNRGRVVEAGTHRELLDHSGHYRRFHDLQFHASGENGSQFKKTGRKL